MQDISFSNLIDLASVNRMISSLSSATKIPVSIYGVDGDSALVRAGWQDICATFHRANEKSVKRCKANLNLMKSFLSRGEICGNKCKNGMWGISVPVMVNDEHMATVYCGQFLLKEDGCQQDRFKEQAYRFGYDEQTYLTAVDKVPVLSNDQVEYITEYNKALASLLTTQAEHSLTISATEKALGDSHSRYRELFNSAPMGILMADDRPKIFDANKRAAEITGFSRAEICALDTREILQPETIADITDPPANDISGANGSVIYERMLRTKNHNHIPVEVSLFVSPDTGYHTIVFQDITQRKKIEKDLRRSQNELEEKVYERTSALTCTVKELQRRNFESETISRVGELLQACETEEESYQIVSSLCRQLFPNQCGYLATYDDDGDIIRAVTTFGSFQGNDIEFETRDCWALRRGAPHQVNNSEEDPVCKHCSEHTNFSSLCVPVEVKGEFLGLFHLFWDRESAKTCDGEQDIDSLAGLAKRVAELYTLSLSNVRLRSRLRRQSIRDSLTSLYNRRHMEESLTREIARARRKESSVGIILFDVDHFKSFNDNYGHDAGDEVLRSIGLVLQDITRDEDIPCRFGGEEFLVILPDCDLEFTRRRAEDIRKNVEEMPNLYRGNISNVTISLGVASYPEHGNIHSEVVSMADTAMYRAKKGGRNRVVVATLSSLENSGRVNKS